MSVDTQAGIERVSVSGSPPQWSVTPLVDLGGLGLGNALQADEFAWVSSAALGPEGQLHVTDIRQDRIAVFDTLGRHVRDLGRQGQGPGEFESLYSVAWIADTLLALDIGNARISRWAGSGWHGTDPAPGRLVASPVTYRLYQVGPTEVYQWAYRPDEDVVEPTWRGLGEAQGIEWLRTGLPLTPAFPDKVVCTLARGFSWWDHPYAERSLSHPAPGGTVYLARSSEYTIVQVDAEGDTLRVLRRDVDPVPLEDPEWDRTETAFNEWLADKSQADCTPRHPLRPETKPPLVALHVDVAGRLWVERNLSSGTEWEVFEAGGRLIGRVPGFDHDRLRTVPWIGPDHVVWVTRDSLDLPYVHLARVTPSG